MKSTPNPQAASEICSARPIPFAGSRFVLALKNAVAL